jgi:rhomboid protease GluP
MFFLGYHGGMFRRQRTGSVVCSSCGSLVGVQDERCYTCGRTNPGLWGFAPALRRLGADLGFVRFVMVASGALYVLSLLLSGGAIRMQGLMTLLAPSVQSLFLLGASGAVPVFEFGRWWTVASAGWLHGGLLHIFFNLMWVRQLGPSTADVYGPGRMIVIYTVAGICGFTLSTVAGELLPGIPFLGGAQFTIGASAPIFGLLGALVYYGRRSGSSLIRSEAVGYAAGLFIFGLIMPGVDNYAHAGGFLGGYATGALLDPLKPERIDHIAMGLACLFLSALAIAASVLHGLRLFLR